MSASTRARKPKSAQRARGAAKVESTTGPRGPAARVEGGKIVRKPAKKKSRTRKPRYTAATADKHELYQLAVQSADTDVAFHRRVFKSLRGREPLHFREDFCGTGLLSSEWIQLSRRHTAEGFDIDPAPIAWGLAHNFDPLGAVASRYTVHVKDVRSLSRVPADVRVAQNFSYYCMTTRAELLSYFRAARANLSRDGIFIIDLYGGTEASEVMEETQRCPGFTYVWEQAAFHPGTGEYVCHIHFRFSDGTELKRAFTYRWRLWSLMELRDVLLDAGFSKVINYFEGSAKDGDGGNGIFRPGVRGENCAAWIAYLVALR